MSDCSGIKKDSVVTVISYFVFSDIVLIVSVNRSNLVMVWFSWGQYLLGGSVFRFRINIKEPAK